MLGAAALIPSVATWVVAQRLTSLTVTGLTNINSGIKTTANQTYNNAVTLTSDSILDSSGGNGNIHFVSTINGAHALTLTSGTGTDTFSGIVGGTALSSLADTASHIDLNGGSIATTGNQTYTGAVLLGADTTLDSSGSNGNIHFTSTVDGGHSLTLTSGTGTDTFSGAVGTTALSSLADTASHIDLNGSSVTTTGNQTYSGAVLLGTDTTLDSSGSNGNIHFTSTVDGTHALTLTSGTGADTFSGAVGGGTPLTGLSIAAGGGIAFDGNVNAATILANTIADSTGNITIGAGVTLTATGNGNALVLASGENLVNNAGAGALSAASGRWIVYSTNVANDTGGAATLNPA